jgi:signal transduction histidine kinase
MSFRPSIKFVLAVVTLVPMLLAGGLTLVVARSTANSISSSLAVESAQGITRQLESELSTFLKQASQVGDILSARVVERDLDPDDLGNWQLRMFAVLNGVPDIASITFVDNRLNATWLMRFPPELEFGLVDRASGTVRSVPARSDGTILWQSERVHEYDVSKRPWYQNAISRPGPTWTEPYQWFGSKERQSDSEFAIANTRVILDDDRAKSPLGVLSIDVSLARANDNLATLARPHRARIILADSSGQIIARSARRSDAVANGDPVIEAELEHAMVRQLNNSDGHPDSDPKTVVIDGDEYRIRAAALSLAGNDNWRLLTAIPESSSLVAAYDAQRWLALVGILALLCSGVFAVWLSRLVSSPMEKLSDFAGYIADGHFDRRIRIGRTKEIRALSDELNRMAAALQTQVQTLSERDSARQSSEIKSRLVAHVSHEFRTPLTAIIGYGELLRDEAREADRPQTASDAANVIAAGTHLLSLVNNLLDLSRIEAGVLQLNLSTFDIPMLMKEIEGTMSYLAAKRNNTIVVNYPPDLGTMHADPARTKQILLNLMSNANKFTTGGRIEFSAFCTDYHVLFLVRDHGSGMTGVQLEHLFKPFTQVHVDRQQRANEGAGLGLAISRQLTTLMHGAISVVSEPTKGSEFTVVLPLNVEAPPFVDANDALQEHGANISRVKP